MSGDSKRGKGEEEVAFLEWSRPFVEQSRVLQYCWPQGAAGSGGEDGAADGRGKGFLEIQAQIGAPEPHLTSFSGQESLCISLCSVPGPLLSGSSPGSLQ